MKEVRLKKFQKRTVAVFDKLPKGNVLDIAAGCGAIVLALREKGFTVSACDINTKGCEENGVDCTFVDLNDGKLPFGDNLFDYIVFSESLQYLENPHSFMREVKRVTKSGSIFVSTFPNILNIQSRVKYLLNGYKDFFKPVYEVPKDEKGIRRLGINPVDLVEYKFILERFGFNIKEVASSRTKNGFYVYALLGAFITTLTFLTSSTKKDSVKSVKRLLNSWTLLFSEGLLIVAEKEQTKKLSQS